MATMLDVSFLGNLMPIWILILVFAIVYALLSVTKAVGENKNIQAIIALVVAIASILSSKVISFISVFIPWIVVFFIFVIMLIIGFRIFQGDVTSIKMPFPKQTMGWIIFLIIVAIALGSFASIVGPSQVAVTEGGTAINASTGATSGSSATATTLPGHTTDYGKRVGSAFYNPKVLGFILIILIAVFGIALLTSVSTKIVQDDNGNGGHH